ncbi:MAG: dihydroflavonol 4-reductase [Microbacteriaceae bacterium]|nr:dihydroflavonol 4-reductase [Microbacteriaceae bacterium]
MVTGATGLVGANVCAIAAGQGDDVIALVRSGSDSSQLEALGVRVHYGDIASAGEVRAAAQGADVIVHSAAVLGSVYSSQDPAVHDAVNVGGMTNVLDAAEATGARVVAISTTAILQAGSMLTEHTPVSAPGPTDSNYTRTKRVAYLELERRAAGGLHAQTVFPGAIYGPSPVSKRAVEAAGQNAKIIRAIRGELRRYPAITVGWVLGHEVAARALLAARLGEPGATYLAMGDQRDAQTFPEFLSMACELAGVPNRVEAAPKIAEDPTVLVEFGPFAYEAEIAKPVPIFDDLETRINLGHMPAGVAEGLPLVVAWLADVGEI